MGKKTTGSLAALVVILLALNIFQFYYFNYMRSTVPAEDAPTQLSELQGSDWQSFVGKRVTVEGFFARVRPDLLMLVSSLDYLQKNTPIPDDRFMRILDNLPETLLASSGSRVYIKGTLNQSDMAGEKLVLAKYISHKIVEVATKPWSESIVSVTIIPGIRFATNYAVLISGGYNSTMAFFRYWNDLKYMYSILVNRYYYNPKNIYVIYKDGVAEDAQMPVNYSATFASVQTVFNQLAEKMTPKDNLFIYTTNHGGPSGLCLYYNPTLTPGQLATMLNNLDYNTITVVMEQCFSGNFISQISGASRVILTACSASEYSWSCDEGPYDEFVYHFMSAVNFQTPGGVAVNADTNGNGRISMVEAFNYASDHDSAPESPYYDDNGDAVGHVAVIPNGGDGTLGSNVYL